MAGFAQGVSGVTWTAVGGSGKLGTWDDCMLLYDQDDHPKSPKSDHETTH